MLDENLSPESTLRGRLVMWISALSLVGYPLVGLLATALNLDSRETSIPFRAAVILLVALLFGVGRLSRHCQLSRRYIWLLAFWLLYLIRLIWDFRVAEIPGAGGALTFFLVTIFIPCVALMLNAGMIQERSLATLLAGIGAAICTISVLIYFSVRMHFTDWGIDRSLTEATGRLSFEAVNPITLGHMAVTVLISLLCLSRQRMSVAKIVALTTVAVLAIVVLVLAGSRGPLLALVGCLLVFVAATRRWRWAVLLVLLAPILLNEEFELAQRFASIQDDDSAHQRLSLQSNAINQFLGYPVLGSAFVELESLTYPHNLFIETAMALGLVGLGLLLVILASASRQVVRSIRSGDLLVPLIFIQYFIAAQFSGSLYGLAGLWVALVMVLGFGIPSRGGMRVLNTQLEPVS